MFFQRLMTTLILIPIVLSAIFYAAPWFLGLITLIVLMIAGVECWRLIPIQRPATRGVYLLLLILATLLCGYVFHYWLFIGLLLWIVVILVVLSYPASQKLWGRPSIVASACLIILPLFVQSLIHLYFMTQGKELLVYLLFLIWSADIGAYLAGKNFGKHKLIPQVSPGKSWEGLFGGFLMAMIITTGSCFYFAPDSKSMWFSLAIGTVVISIFGDLFESVLKRRCHLKDSGSIIPGHGGILDRLDSLIAALPLFYFGLTHFPGSI